MPASVTRNEYYWERNRLICRQNRRSSIFGQWRLTGNAAELVVAIEDLGNSRKMTEGGAASPARVIHAILRENRLSADLTAADIGAAIPQPLITRAVEIVQACVAEVTRQYHELSNEERRTGAVSYDLNKHRSLEYQGWEMSVTLQGFSTQKKEPFVGADLGLVVDLKQGQKHVSKAVLIQAKEASTMPKDPMTLDRLDKQITDMLKRTKEAYGMVYTPNGVFLFRGRNGKELITLDVLISDIARCHRGDRNPELLADAIEEEYTVEIAFQNFSFPNSTRSTIIN